MQLENSLSWVNMYTKVQINLIYYIACIEKYGRGRFHILSHHYYIYIIYIPLPIPLPILLSVFIITRFQC